MYRILLFFGLISACFSQTFQLDEKEFFLSIQDSYYSLNNSGITNFTCLVSNSSLEEFAEKNWDNPEVFPIQFIWMKPDRVFLSQQGVPALSDTTQEVFIKKLADLKQQVKAVLLDLQRFYFTGIYSSISDDYILIKKKQVIEILFNQSSDSILTQFKYVFGMNGLCLKVEAFYPEEKRAIITYPTFKIVKTKWLCEGWEVQILQNDQIESGFAVKLDNNLTDKTWVPVNLNLEVQKKAEPGKVYVDVIKFRSYLFDQSLQLMEKSN